MGARRLFVVVAVLVGLLPAAAPARDLVPANDNFADATPIDILPYVSGHDMALAGMETGEPLCTGILTGHTVWYSFVWPAAIDLDLFTYGSSAIGIYTGSNVGALNEISCDYWETQLSAEAGRTYYIQVGVDETAELPFDHVELHVTARARIAGRVVGPAGQPLPGVCVAAYLPDTTYYTDYATTTLSDGTYMLAGLPPATYLVDFGCGTGRWAREWYNDQATSATADRLVLQPGATVTGIDAALAQGSVISGTLHEAGGGIASDVCAAAMDAADHTIGYARSDSEGAYSINVPPGTYRVFFGCDFRSRYLPSFYDGKATYAEADPVSVAAGTETGGIDAALTRKPYPANDDLENATQITDLPFTDVLYTDQLRDEFEPDPCGDSVWPGAVWYKFTPSRDMLLVASATQEEDVPSPAIVVFSGSVSASRRVACTDADHDRAVFLATAGTTYFVEVVIRYPFFFGGSGPLTFEIDEALGRATHEFGPALPCAAACSYWVGDDLYGLDDNEAACAPEPVGVPASWTDLEVTVPAAVDGFVPARLAFWMRPALDSDVFLCRAEPDEEGRRFVALGAYGPADCQAEAAKCSDTVSGPVAPGESYVLRVYNWSDTLQVTGAYGFVVDR